MTKYKIILINEKGRKFEHEYKRIDTMIDAFWFFVVDDINAPIRSSIHVFKNDRDITSCIILNSNLMKRYFKGTGAEQWSEEELNK